MIDVNEGAANENNTMNTVAVMAIAALLMAVIGSAWDGPFGAMVGIALGVLTGLHAGLRARIGRLEHELAQLRRAGAAANATAPAPLATATDTDTVAAVAPSDTEATPDDIDAAFTPAPDTTAHAPAPPATPAPPRRPPEPDALQKGMQWLKTYMTTGNVVAKVGVLVLFVGVSFLLKYAIDRNALPIEVRLAGTAAGAIALLLVGWRLRLARAAFAVILQGAAVGILYLVAFAAARLYHTVPLGFTFALLLALVALSALLAVLQDARALATLGTIGGFLAPILTSTGGGSHVALFSYYALLNLGIVGIAWFRAWRVLNWVGFVFTFVIGAAWGARYYQPEFFASTEPFLALSFVFYLAVAVLFAHRHPPQLRGVVDGTLVFGLPLVVFGLQSMLVRDIPFGRAWSAVAMGAVYLGLARWLIGRGIAELRLLAESFLALGVVAASLAIPFALDGHLTAAAWALEGAGLVWIGLRQQRLRARLFGTLLQFAAGAAFFLMHGDAGSVPIANTNFLGGLFIALGALLSSRLLYHGRDALHAAERITHALLLGWGLWWWFGNGLHEIGRFAPQSYESAAMLLFLAASVAALADGAARLDWLPAQRVTLAWPLAAMLIAIAAFADARMAGPLADLRWLGWSAALAATLFALRRGEPVLSGQATRAGHAIAWWSALFLGCWSLEWALRAWLPAGGTWSFVAWGALPALALHAMPRAVARIDWPLRRFAGTYLGSAQLPVAVWLLLWVLHACTRAGDPWPLRFLPLLNPLDLAQLLCLLAVAAWWFAPAHAALLRAWRPPQPALVWALLGGVGFFWLNAATARAVHFLGGVPFAVDALHHSPVFQGAISVLWGITALALMRTATQRALRTLWLVGAALLAALVLKLFFVDLSGSGTMARIVSFMAAGGLMVLIGYLSPAPPRARKAA